MHINISFFTFIVYSGFHGESWLGRDSSSVSSEDWHGLNEGCLTNVYSRAQVTP